jgi:uncharacterized protein (DUF427 family)
MKTLWYSVRTPAVVWVFQLPIDRAARTEEQAAVYEKLVDLAVMYDVPVQVSGAKPSG